MFMLSSRVVVFPKNSWPLPTPFRTLTIRSRHIILTSTKKVMSLIMENNTSSQSETHTESDDPYPSSILIMIQQGGGSGYYLSNGEESDETKFMSDFFYIYDEYSNTDLLSLFKNALANGNSRLDWNGATELRDCMHGITGTGYTAVMRWIVIGLNEIQYSLKQDDVIKLFTLSKKVCKWRKRMIDIHRHPNNIAERIRHENALDRWEEIKRVLEDFHTRNIWEQD